MNARVIPPLVTCSVLSAALWLASCGSGDPEKLLASAQGYLQRQDVPAAIIELKTALKAKPDFVAARLLLGQALQAGGDSEGAATEYRKALDGGAPAAQVLPLLAEALLAQQDYRRLTTDYATEQLDTPQAQASLRTSVAIAWLRLGQEDAFKTNLEAALQAQPDYVPALVEQARTHARHGAVDTALASLDKIPAQASGADQARKLRGDLLLTDKRDPDGAMVAYQEALKLNPQSKDTQAAIVQLLLLQGKTDAAAQALQGLEKAAPGRPTTLYLQAMLAYAQNDFKKAQELGRKLLNATPENPRALELAGMTELRLDGLVQAEALLTKALQMQPGLPMARRGLVSAYMRLGRLDRAQATLPADIEHGDSDPSMLALAGQVAMLQGEAERAQRYFTQAATLDPHDPVKRTSLAVSKLALGQEDAALHDLRSIAASDEGVVADMALINTLLRERKIDEALKAIDAMEKKRPTDVLPPFLRGRALLLQRDGPGVRKAMERVLALDPNYFPAVAVLAMLDNGEQGEKAARARLDAFIQRQPGNVPARLALVELRQAHGADKAELAQLLRQAIDAAPSSPIPRLALIDHALRNGEAKEALSVAQQATAALPDNAQLLDAQGRAQIAAQEYNQAVGSFGRVAALTPQSPQPYLRMSSAQLLAGDRMAAQQTLRKALELDPQLLPAQQGLVSLAMGAQHVDEALALSKTVQKQRPKEAVGYLLEGQIYATSKAWDKALEAYRVGLKQVRSPELAIGLHGTLVAAGKKAEAERWALEWQRLQPEEPGFPFYLGQTALARSDYAESLRQFERVMALQPENAVALNNVAWLKGQLGREGALADAERANQLMPNQPALLDTWAMLLSAAKQHERALELEKKAVQLQPQQPMFKLNLAKIELQAGNKDAARRLLDELSAAGAQFPAQDQVQQLRKSL